MPKIICNKKLIIDAYKNRKELQLTVQKIADIFQVDPKTINNYKKLSDEQLSSNIINKKKKIDDIPDNVIKFIIDDVKNNQYFKIIKTISKVRKMFKIELKKYQIYDILKNNNITFKKSVIKYKVNNIEKEQKAIEETIKNVKNVNNEPKKDDVIFIDEVHIEVEMINDYGWNKKGEKVVFRNDVPAKLKNKRFSIIAAVSRTDKIYYEIHKDSVDGNKFKRFIKRLNRRTKKNV